MADMSSEKPKLAPKPTEPYRPGVRLANEIEPGLLLGGIEDARSLPFLQRERVSLVLSISSFPETLNLPAGINSEFIQADDCESQDLLSKFDETFEIISKVQQSGVVLVHCQLGVSRSATIVVAYLMRKYKQSFEDTMEKVRCLRSAARPNNGFVKQLQIYEQMSFRVDVEHQLYKDFRQQIAKMPFVLLGQGDGTKRWISNSDNPELEMPPNSKFEPRVATFFYQSRRNCLKNLKKYLGESS